MEGHHCPASLSVWKASQPGLSGAQILVGSKKDVPECPSCLILNVSQNHIPECPSSLLPAHAALMEVIASHL